MSIRCLRRAPGLLGDSFDEAISDGFMGLVQAIRDAKDFQWKKFRFIASGNIRRHIFRERLARSWAGRSRAERLRTIDLVHGFLSGRMDREPTKEEMLAELKNRTSHWKDYLIYLEEPSPRMRNFPQDAEGRSAWRSIADPSMQRPLDVLVARETGRDPSRALRLASRGLSRRDRRILEILLDGGGVSDVMRVTGVPESTATYRVRRVQWKLRFNKELARSLGVVPENGNPPKPRNGKQPRFDPPPAPLSPAPLAA